MNNERLIYLAGPINGCSDQEAHGWRDDVIAELAGHGYTFLNPMDRDYRNINADHAACKAAAHEVCFGDKEDIMSCGIFLAALPKPSFGTPMELMYAYLYGKLTLSVIPPEPAPLSPWVAKHSHGLFYSFPEVIHYLKEYH